MKNRKKVISILLILALVFTLTPVSPFMAEADADTVTVSDLDGLKTAIENAETNGTTEITVEKYFPISEDVTLDGGTSNVTLNMNTNYFQFYNNDGEGFSLTLKNLNINIAAGGILVRPQIDNCKLIIDGCSINSADSSSSDFIVRSNKTFEMQIYKGSITTNGKLFNKDDKGKCTYLPTGDISVSCGVKSKYAMSFIHQNKYNVTSGSINDEELTSETITAINASTQDSPYEHGSAEYGNVALTVEKEAAEEEPNINAGGSKTESGVAYAWSYGGTVTPKADGSFAVKPYQKSDVNYVIDSIVVNGEAVALDDKDKKGEYTYTAPEGTTVTSIFASFAYTVNFNDPANGTLSVSRDGEDLTSGDIVRGGEHLSISFTGADGHVLDKYVFTGINETPNEDGTYTVIAQNGEPTPAISVITKFQNTLKEPKFRITDGTPVKQRDRLYIDEIEDGASVYYTLNGKEPTVDSTLYDAESGITGFAGRTVKAVAVKSDCNNSPVITATYPEAAGYRLSIGCWGYGNATVNYEVKVNDEVSEASEQGTAGTNTSSLATKAYDGDTVKIKPVIPDGYKLVRVNASGNLCNEVLNCDNDGWYSLSVDDRFKTSSTADSSIRIILDVFNKIDISVLPGIEHGKVNTNFDEFIKAGGYTTQERDIDNGFIVVTPVADKDFRLKSGSLKWKDADDENAEWIDVEYSDGKWQFKPLVILNGAWTSVKKAIIKAEFEEGDAKLEISNEEELRAFAEEVNSGNTYADWLVTLTDDIKLTEEWTPAGEYKLVGNTYYQREFNGVFDGQGHTISGLSINTDAAEGYFGLFGKAGDIKNVTVRGSINCDGKRGDIGGGNYYIGGIAGYARNVTNCTSYVDITTSSAGHTGGIAGSLSSASGCMNYGDVTVDRSSVNAADRLANEWVGGIAGYASGAISESANYGDISFDAGKFTTGNTGSGVSGVVFDGTASSTGGFGGIAGYAASGTFTDVVNRGNITGHMRLAGGIIGNAGQFGRTLTNCYNTGSVTSTGDHYLNHEIRLGGIVGSNAFCQSDLTLNNCYSTGNITAAGEGNIAVDEIQANEADRNRLEGRPSDAVFTLNNTYGPSDIDKVTVEQMGDGYVADTTGINGGLPVLKWESSVNVSDDLHAVVIKTDPADATVTVTDFEGNTVDVSKGLKMGTYHYKAVKAGYLDAEGSFTVATKDKTVSITLYKKATIRFEITPADAVFTLVDGYGRQIKPVKDNTYELGVGGSYVYNAVKDGYNGAGGVIEVNGDETIKITLTKVAEATGGEIYGDGNDGKINTISAGGTYRLGEGATGLVTVATSEAVTLIGSGTASSSRFDDLYIDCTVAGSTLTLENVYIDVQTGRTNVIDFTGTGNTLNFSGTSIIDLDTNAFGCAMVHVPKGTSLKVTGGTAYLYKREQGAMFGGNGGAKGTEGQSTETNGDITVSGATLFAKSTKQGALFGAGAGAGSSSVPGSIKIENSELYLIANSRAAAIGGSAGSNGASPGADVTVTDSNITINVDYTGAAIGGGGYADGNDAKGGTLKVSGSSIRTYIDANAKDLWNVAGAGVNGNKAITADIKDAAGNPLYLAQIDTSGLSKAAAYQVKSGNTTVYSGGLHRYASVNESYEKDSQTRIDYTPNNWYSLNDSSLYVYLRGETQELTVNGTGFKAEFDAQNKEFTVTKVAEAVNEVTVIKGDTTEVAVPVDVKKDGTTATVTVTDKNAQEMIKQTKENKADEISFTVTDDAASEADRINLVLDTKVIKDIAENTTADVTLNTPSGNVTLDEAALDKIAKDAKGSTVEITIEKVKTDKTSENLVGETGQIFGIGVKSGTQQITDLGGKMTLELPIPGALKDRNIAAAYMTDDGLEFIEGKIVGDKYYITVTKTGKYVLVDRDAVKTDTGADAAKVKSLTKALKLKASTSLTSKKNVKVTAKVTKGSIKKITDLGYKVKYKYYRSVKKTSKYKAVKTKTAKTYINTKGSKNKKYYYKVKVCVYDKDGKLAASTALTQCKYGCRIWKK